MKKWCKDCQWWNLQTTPDIGKCWKGIAFKKGVNGSQYPIDQPRIKFGRDTACGEFEEKIK